MAIQGCPDPLVPCVNEHLMIYRSWSYSVVLSPSIEGTLISMENIEISTSLPYIIILVSCVNERLIVYRLSTYGGRTVQFEQDAL
jgi:hypothetical protein